MEMGKICKRLFCALLVVAMFVAFVPALGSFEVSAAGTAAGSRLTGMNKTIYDFLKPHITAVANGTKSSTEITMTDSLESLKWTKEQLGVSTIIADNAITLEARAAMQEKLYEVIDFKKINTCLVADCAYELYWHDKVTGTGFLPNINANTDEIKITNIVFKFAVTADYAAGDFAVDTAKTAAAASAANNAKAIVAKHASKTDLEKLTAYKDEICALADYDNAAAQDPATPYGNPWQLINVFDKDPATKVVCEGYAKAFQYLCELSTFKGNVKTYLVNGYMQGGTGEGGHMWNVVQIDGATLLVDITNCDEGSAGAPDQLFLKSGTKSGDWYLFNTTSTTVRYAYAPNEKGLYTNDYLELSGSVAQAPTEPATQPTEAPTEVQTTPATVPTETQPVPTHPATAAPTVPAVAPTQPITTPATAQPTVPAVTTPVATAPNLTEPAVTQPTVQPTVATVPVATDPAPTDAGQTEPQTTQPSETVSPETVPSQTIPVGTDEPEITVPVIPDEPKNDNTVLFVVIGVVCAAAIAAGVLFFIKRKKA